MSKYIIKNCPNYRDREVDYTCTIEAISSDCHNCTDCVLKQIVKNCRDTERYYSECIAKNRETNWQYMDEEDMTWLMGRSHHAGEILRLLDIQEVE